MEYPMTVNPGTAGRASEKKCQNAHYAHFKECLRIEIISREGKKDFSWSRVVRRVLLNYKCRYYFWWRLANYLHTSASPTRRKWARKINHRLLQKYGVDIGVEAIIAPGMTISHYTGIVVRGECIIGKNVRLRQNTTIGRKHPDMNSGITVIGDNVDIGAHSCIIGDITLGDNVTVGAMAFVNCDVPSDSLVVSEKRTLIRSKRKENG